MRHWYLFLWLPILLVLCGAFAIDSSDSDRFKIVDYKKVHLDCPEYGVYIKRCKYNSIEIGTNDATPETFLTISTGKTVRTFQDTLLDYLSLEFELFEAKEAYVLLMVQTHEYNTSVRVFELSGDAVSEYGRFSFEGPSENQERIEYEVSKQGSELFVRKKSEETFEVERVLE